MPFGHMRKDASAGGPCLPRAAKECRSRGTIHAMSGDAQPEVSALAVNVTIPETRRWTDTRRGETFTLTTLNIGCSPTVSLRRRPTAVQPAKAAAHTSRSPSPTGRSSPCLSPMLPAAPACCGPRTAVSADESWQGRGAQVDKHARVRGRKTRSWFSRHGAVQAASGRGGSPLCSDAYISS